MKNILIGIAVLALLAVGGYGTYTLYKKGELKPPADTTNNNTIPQEEEKPNTYASTTGGFSINYPQDYTLDEAYAYDQFGEKKLIHGVKFHIPTTIATGTNLSSFDTGVSVESLPRAKTCTGDIYILDNVKATKITENGIDYLLATTSGAGAGNRYEEQVYALATSSPCIAIRYFIHSTVVQNYPEGTVREYDRTKLLSDFDKIRQSLVLNK